MVIIIELNRLLDGRSLNWLSRETGIRWPTLAVMARGETQRIELNQLASLCEALQCEPGELLRLENQKRRKKRGA
jgi:putative transcriptional regulator